MRWRRKVEAGEWRPKARVFDASLFVCACRRENPIGQKRSRCEHDTNFKETHCVLQATVSTNISLHIFDRVSLFSFKTCRCACVAIIKCKAGTQRDREEQGVMDGQSSLVQEVLDVGLPSSLTSPKESAIDYIYTACYWYANHRLAFCKWVSGCLQSA